MPDGNDTRATPAELTTFANDVHGYLRQNITWADQKAAFLFAAVSAFIAFLHTKKALGVWRDGRAFAWQDAVGLAAGMCLLAAAGCAFVTFWPSRKGKSTGLVFWGSIAGKPSAGAYLDDVSLLSARELAEEKLRHSYELAKISARKFAWVDWASRFAIVGFAVAIARIVIWP
jgi:hypothetical protein